MTKNRLTPKDIHIPNPCSKSWHEMQGDDKKRFCGGCQRYVYNVTGFSREEFRQLLRDNKGKACIVIF